MKTKQEQIEEMAKIVDEMYNVYTTTAEDIAEGLYNAGYRKTFASDKEIIAQKEETVKEFAEKLWNKIKDNGIDYKIGLRALGEEIDELLKEYER